MVLCLVTYTRIVRAGLSVSADLLFGHVSVGMRTQAVTTTQEERVE